MMQRGIKRPRSEALQTGSTTTNTTTSIVDGNTNAIDNNVAVPAIGALGVESKVIGVEAATGTITTGVGSSNSTSSTPALVVRGHKRKGSHHPHGPESLATEEGAQMSNLYQSWTSEQQDRFAAFRRCTFRKETISKLVTFCLAKEQQQRISLYNNACQLLLDSSSIMKNNTSFNENYQPQLTLQDFVAPNCASEIISVVSTIAKSYAQRLVAATRQLATQEYNYPTTQKLLPQFYLQTYRQRVQHGLDPGFFIFPSPQQQQQQQPNSSVPIHNPCHTAGTTGSSNQSSYQRLFSVQLAAAREAEKEFNELTTLPDEEDEETKEETEAPTA